MSSADKAEIMFRGPYNCAQSVFAALAPAFGLEPEIALRIASGLGGGIGHLGSEVCGAVSGVVLAIGLQREYLPEDRAERERTYALVREFAHQFGILYGHLRCRELLGHDISTPEGYQAAADNGLYETRCSQLVHDAVEIVEQLLALEEGN